MWYNSNWKFRKKITINHTKVEGNGTFTDFPVLISITDQNIINSSQSSGNDLVITDSNNTKLDHEIETYNTTTNQIIIWVRVPLLFGSIDTQLYLYYGNQTVTSQQNSSGVWNQNYKAVFHFKEQGNTNANGYSDSTANSNHGTGFNLDSTNTVTGKIGNSQYFNGVDEYIAINQTSGLPIYNNNKYAISLWISGPGSQNDKRFFAEGSSSSNNPIFGLGTNQNSGVLDVFIRNNSGSTQINHLTSTKVILDNTPHKIDWIDNNGTVTLYIDGELDSQNFNYTKSTLTLNKTSVGALLRASVGAFSNELVDELRLIAGELPNVNWIKTEYNNQSAPSNFITVGLQEINFKIQKHYIYRVYDAGSYIATWTKEVIGDPSFTVNINGGAGELNITLARPFDDFGEDEDVKLNNKVECWVVDKDSPNGRLLYSGYISGYKPIISQASESVQITLFSYVAELQRMILRDASGNTTIAYNSYDPAAMMRDVIDKLRALGCSLSYTADSIQNTNNIVSYTFNTNSGKECVDKIIELCPVGWYWRVDPDGIIYLKPKNELSDHTFTLGLEVEKLETFRRVEDLVNRVLFIGAGEPALFRKYENTGSQSTYGLYEKKIVDQRVTSAATASIMANREIDTKKDPEIRSTYEIIDNNGPRGRGYDIESIKVGQTLKVRNLKTGVRASSLWDVAMWDTDVWDQTLSTSAADVIQIQSIRYNPDSVILEASSRLPQIAKRIEDIERNLENTQVVNNPAAPV